MTIRARLFGLIAIFNVVLILSMVYVNVQSASMNRIREEEAILRNMVTALNDEDSILMDLLVSAFDVTFNQYDDIAGQTAAAFDYGRRNITKLPELNPTVKSSLERVFEMDKLMENRRKSLQSDADDFWTTAQEVYLYISGVPMVRILTDDVYKRDGYDRVLETTEKFIASQKVLHDTIQFNLDDLNAQILFINEEINRISRRQNLVMNLGIGGAVLLSIIFSYIIIQVIVRKIHRLKNDIAAVSGGDLSRDIMVIGKDELAELSRDVNGLVVSLRETMDSIQRSARENSRARDGLMRSVQDTAGSVEEGERNVDSILGLTETLDRSVRESASAADLIVERVGGFSEMVEAQVSMVEESTAAITEINASLGNMSRVVATNREAASKLGEASREGSERIEETGSIIRRVGGHVNAIQEMADVIKGVADQTNLLAMNAAIEAAHAGDAGRGFGVVADEIRKLSETTAENSRVISENLRAIITDIKEAGDASSGTISSFETIDGEVKGVINSLTEVAASIEELGEGGGQVMEAMNALQDYTVKVKDSSADISENILSVRNSVSIATDVSRQVSTGSGEIRTGMSIIRLSSERTRDVADDIRTVGTSLDDAVGRFRTGTEITGTSREPVSPESVYVPAAETAEEPEPGKTPVAAEQKPGRIPFVAESVPVFVPAAESAEEPESGKNPVAAELEPALEGVVSEGLVLEESMPELSPDIENAPDSDAEKSRIARTFGPVDYALMDDRSIAPPMEEPPELEPEGGTDLTFDVNEGITLSEGDWVEKEEITVVDAEGRETDQ